MDLYRCTKKIMLQRRVFSIYYNRNSKKQLHYSREKLKKQMDRKTFNTKEMRARYLLLLMNFNCARRNQLIYSKKKQKTSLKSPLVAIKIALTIMILKWNVEQAIAAMFNWTAFPRQLLTCRYFRITVKKIMKFNRERNQFLVNKHSSASDHTNLEILMLGLQ